MLGELSNNGGAWRKFAQTFFLAEQPNGYYVLNDIFRYLKDEDEIEAEAEAVDEAIQDEIDEADKKGVEVPHSIEVNNIGNSNARPHLPSSSSSSTPAAPSKAIESTEARSMTLPRSATSLLSTRSSQPRPPASPPRLTSTRSASTRR